MSTPDNLPPLPPNTRYGGRLRDYEQPDIIGHIYEECDGDRWSDIMSWTGMAGEPENDSADWHVALPIGAVRESATGVEARVCEDIAARQRLGIAKYGVTVEQSKDDMLRHAYEEALDFAVYLKAELERRQP